MQVEFKKFEKLFALLSSGTIYTIIMLILTVPVGPRRNGGKAGMIQQDEMKGGVKVSELVEHLDLAVVNKGADFDTALVGIKDVNRPGLQLVGFFEYFDERRLQVIGMAETQMLNSMDPEQRSRRVMMGTSMPRMFTRSSSRPKRS